MGQQISSFFAQLFQDKEARILMLGLDAAGKTSVLYKLYIDENVTTIPTIGFNVETVQYKKTKFTVFDLGGQDKIRSLWRHYYENNDAVVFVVDSNDRERFNEVRETLHHVMQANQLEKCKLLVLANKQDLPHAASASELASKLDLNSIKQEWFIQPCSAFRGTGLFEGFDWLSNKL